MNEYIAPLHEMRFLLHDMASLDEVAGLPGYEETSPDLADAILEEAGKFANGVLSPLNRSGDIEGARWQADGVRMPGGWREAYKLFSESGWTSLASPKESGGQELPQLLSTFVEEIWNGANMAFALSPMLTRGAQQVLELRGSDYLKRTFLPAMVRGEWTGTMVLTEPQAGSDLAAIRTRAIRQADGTYRLHGQKIFITYGDHDMAPNIVHLVLARVEGAPAGSKGISLFVVPKILVDADGSLGAPNDVRCVSIEHKMGIHASPTCVMAFGDNQGATGYLVGEENRGLDNMFIMMNAARFAVGLEGLGIGERAYQRALAYAKERIQGSELGDKSGTRVPIVRHPDVRRMLLSMKSRIEVMRAQACSIAVAMDVAARHPDEAMRNESLAFVDLMMPVAKGWFTESGIDIASLGIQIHGGIGFIEETGAAQHLRDARITAIYEGTTGIQAADLIGRKVARDEGKSILALVEKMRKVQSDLERHDESDLTALGTALRDGIDALTRSVEFVLDTYAVEPNRAAAGAAPFLELFSIVTGGWQLGRSALVATDKLRAAAGQSTFYKTKVRTARFFTDHFLSRANGLALAITAGAEAVLAMDESNF
ncbi:acyl-CoA dehydrogenase [Aromatoleum bremense]|uniref:Acyl-CoA dehydrogenase n=1 Tax=Aromatoleum bremense TaxID=76115 RepID=A0ABX1NZX0_9RHOO|nr:acyl-CoA dehydrogenase [Aromatoleum bremense]NMG17030.1 acyl-CoA dehydrogenase [Aromatoleum bremense]QTQ34177.1 Acyl-CoA dehydrogenase/oxidase [Aromatoleum bremense]